MASLFSSSFWELFFAGYDFPGPPPDAIRIGHYDIPLVEGDRMEPHGIGPFASGIFERANIELSDSQPTNQQPLEALEEEDSDDDDDDDGDDDDDLFFDTFEDTFARDEALVWNPPSPDNTIPETKQQKKGLIKRLITAIKDTTDVRERTTSKPFLNRWGPNASFYEEKDFAIIAWRILLLTIRIHKQGWDSYLADKTLRADIKASEGLTFQGRIESIIELLSSSKRTCEDLLKNDRLHQVVGAPKRLIARTRTNQVANSNKAVRIRNGVEFEKRASGASNLKRGRDDDEESEQDLASSVHRSSKRACP